MRSQGDAGKGGPMDGLVPGHGRAHPRSWESPFRCWAKAPGWDGGGEAPTRAPSCPSQAARRDGAVGSSWVSFMNLSPQCHPALDGQRGKCWCVDRKTGVKLPGFLELKGDLDCHQLADSM